jgi:hypothetical protein
MGRPPIYDKAMTAAERQRRRRERIAKEVRAHGEPIEVTRRRAFLYRASQAFRLANEIEWADLEIDYKIVKAARDAAKAWTDLAAKARARADATRASEPRSRHRSHRRKAPRR